MLEQGCQIKDPTLDAPEAHDSANDYYGVGERSSQPFDAPGAHLRALIAITCKNRKGMSEECLLHRREITTVMIDKGGNDPRITELVRWSK